MAKRGQVLRGWVAALDREIGSSQSRSIEVPFDLQICILDLVLLLGTWKSREWTKMRKEG